MLSWAKEITVRFATVAMIFAGYNLEGWSQQTVESSAPPVQSNEPKFDYPPIARAARQSGDVELSVLTDGHKVIGFPAFKGPAMLEAPTETSILQWQFQPHSATTFRVVIHYRFSDGEPCADPTAVVRSTGRYEFEVTAGIGDCDRARYLRNKQAHIEQHAYAVGLHVLKNGELTKLPSDVTLSDGTNSIDLPVKDGVFLAPEIYGKAEQLELKARIGSDEIDIPELHTFALEQDWTIELADKNFGQPGDKWFRHHSGIRKGCVITFDPVDGDGTTTSVSNCRHTVNP